VAGCIAGQAGLTRQISLPSSDSLSGEATTRPQALCIYWADARALDQFARHSIHPVPSCADIKFSTTALPFLAGYLLLCRRKVHPPPPGFLADRVVTPGALYNHWNHRPVVIFLQQLFMGVCNFRPPPCQYFHGQRALVSPLRSPLTRLLLLHLSVLLFPKVAVGTHHAEPLLADFLSTSNFTLPGGRACFLSGGGKGTRKRSPPPGSLTNSGKRQHRTTPSTGFPRRVAAKSQRQDASAPSRATRKPKLSQISDASTPSEFTLTPSQSPGPTRSLSDLRVDPRISNDGRPVGI